MNTLKNYLWLFAAILYGISWPIFPGINLSYFAWFSFALLFIQLKDIQTFKKYYILVFSFLYISHFIPFWWVFNVPKNKELILLATLQDTFIISVPYILLFILKKRLPFFKALLLIGLFIPAWEWIFTELENTIGMMCIGYSQGNHLYFMQSADIWGVYGISMLIWWINLGFYCLWTTFKTKMHHRSTVFPIIFILFIVFGSYFYSFHRLSYTFNTEKPKMVLLANTGYAPLKVSEDYWNIIFKDILNKTTLKVREAEEKPAFIVWPESIVNDDWERIQKSLQDSVDTWKTPLILGVKHNRQNKIFLLQPGMPLQYYAKVKLTPFWEGIPFLSRMIESRKFMKSGEKAYTFEMNSMKLGTPICFEQYYPSIWMDMKSNGANTFIQCNYESWLGAYWWKNIFTSITQFRSIETRTNTIRCSNGGPSGIVYHNQKPEIIQDEFATLQFHADASQTFYAKIYFYYPFIFILLALFFFTILKYIEENTD